MEKLEFIVKRLNMAPFHKNISTMSEFDSKSYSEIFDIMCEIVYTVDPEQDAILREPSDAQVTRIINFLTMMKFNIPEDQMEDFYNLLLGGDKEMLQTIMHWCLQKFEHLQKRAYLAKYLMPVEIPAEFLNEDLILELSDRLKDLQADFKEVHKASEQHRSTGAKPAELKAEISQLENEKSQLENKIKRMKKEVKDEDTFKAMLKVIAIIITIFIYISRFSSLVMATHHLLC